jgi:hypothetical protein
MKLLGYQWLLLIVILTGILAQYLSLKIGFCWFKITPIMCFILYFWILFNLIICFWELLIIEHRDKLQYPTQNFYLTQYSINDLFSTKFWIEGWNQYIKADPRYGDPTSPVFRYELFNVLVSCIPSVYIIYHLVSPEASIKQRELYNVFFFYSLLQLAGVFFYFESYFRTYGTKYIGWNRKEETTYLLISCLWILFPLYLILPL